MIVILCEHGEAKPHRFASGRMNSHGTEVAAFADCPGGRVLEQAIIIERPDGGWPRGAKEFRRVVMAAASFHFGYLEQRAEDDALASAQETK